MCPPNAYAPLSLLLRTTAAAGCESAVFAVTARSLHRRRTRRGDGSGCVDVVCTDRPPALLPRATKELSDLAEQFAQDSELSATQGGVFASVRPTSCSRRGARSRRRRCGAARRADEQRGSSRGGGRACRAIRRPRRTAATLRLRRRARPSTPPAAAVAPARSARRSISSRSTPPGHEIRVLGQPRCSRAFRVVTSSRTWRRCRRSQDLDDDELRRLVVRHHRCSTTSGSRRTCEPSLDALRADPRALRRRSGSASLLAPIGARAISSATRGRRCSSCAHGWPADIAELRKVVRLVLPGGRRLLRTMAKMAPTLRGEFGRMPSAPPHGTPSGRGWPCPRPRRHSRRGAAFRRSSRGPPASPRRGGHALHLVDRVELDLAARRAPRVEDPRG